LWEPHKLEKQVHFMQEKDCAFSFTGYEFADEAGVPNGKKVYVPAVISYKQALKNTTIWTSTVMFDLSKLTKSDVYMPNVRRGQDTATWWKVLKIVDSAYGVDEVLSYYRRYASSLSSNKLKALQRTWNLYRKVEHLNIFISAYSFNWYCFNAVRRRI
jgi:teichuronic acid biosynthesis glycosyltransferase TuaG